MGLETIIAGAAAIPALFKTGKDVFGGGDNKTGYTSVDPEASEFNKYLMNYIQGKLEQPYQYRSVPESAYKILNSVSNAYGMGPYTDPGWTTAGGSGGAVTPQSMGMPGAMTGMPGASLGGGARGMPVAGRRGQPGNSM